MNHMVTIEILEKSQPTRPRKWIPVFAVIAFLINLALGLFMLSFWIPDFALFKAMHEAIPAYTFVIDTHSYSLLQLLMAVFVPAGTAVLGLVFIIVCCKICGFRHAYWWLGVFLLIGYIALVLFVIFYALFYFVPVMTNWFNGIPADILNILGTVYAYLCLIWPLAMAFFYFLCFFYNLSYPGKYEAIYELRRRRLKSFRTTDERIEYRNRFYRDYKKGNWISMMLDLHFESLSRDSTAPMSKDAYDFLVYYANLCDDTVNRAVFDAYASEGRYYEVRRIFHDMKDKSETINRGANIVLPHYVPEKPKKKPLPKKAETPKRVDPPLKPADYKTPANDRVKTWTPDDI